MDLADRLSRGAVAALDLAPFDARFGDLSRRVLQGGASRFAAIVDPTEDVDLVVPVGVPDASLNFGALVVQATRVGILWRDAHRGDQHAFVPLGADTRAQWSPVTLDGEQWARFDLDDGHTRLAFLAPPTGSPLLRTTLARKLGVGAAGEAHTQQIPVVTDAVAPPTPVPDAVAPPSAARVPVVPVALTPVTPVAPVAPVAPMARASVPHAPVVKEPVVQEPVVQVPAVQAPWAQATPPAPARPAPQWEAAGPLYRDEPRVAASAPWPTQAPTYGAASAPTYGQPTAYGQPTSYTPTASAPASAPAAPRGMSATMLGFLIGLGATLALGGALIATLLG